MKLKKLVKRALKRPNLYSWNEILFFKNWLEQRRLKKNAKRSNKKK